MEEIIININNNDLVTINSKGLNISYINNDNNCKLQCCYARETERYDAILEQLN